MTASLAWPRLQRLQRMLHELLPRASRPEGDDDAPPWQISEIQCLRGDPIAGRCKVFGIGLNKTGTTSLGVAFQRLGYNHLGYRLDLLKAYRRGRMDDVFAVIDQYESFEDWPYPLIYQELAARYPDAKFILTIRRTPEVWYKSLVKHSRQSRPLHNARKLAYGYRYPDNAKAEHIAFYCRHMEEALGFLGDRAKVLCWETGDGWQELCEFIGAEVPDEPFPHVNQSLPPSLAKRVANLCFCEAEALGVL